jgi:hypothetical protein
LFSRRELARDAKVDDEDGTNAQTMEAIMQAELFGGAGVLQWRFGSKVKVFDKNGMEPRVQFGVIDGEVSGGLWSYRK